MGQLVRIRVENGFGFAMDGFWWVLVALRTKNKTLPPYKEQEIRIPSKEIG